MEKTEPDYEIVVICMTCCLVASALSAAFAYSIAKAHRPKPAVLNETEPEIVQVLEHQQNTVTEVRFRPNASFM